jgi:hypothetical protein
MSLCHGIWDIQFLELIDYYWYSVFGLASMDRFICICVSRLFLLGIRKYYPDVCLAYNRGQPTLLPLTCANARFSMSLLQLQRLHLSISQL